MPSRKYNAPEELPRPKLRIKRNEAEQKLQKRLDTGEELLSRGVNSEADLIAARAELKRWHDFNKELLGTIFTNEKFADDYEHHSHGLAVWTSGLHHQYQNYVNSVRAKITSLSSIKDRLELIEEDDGSGTISNHSTQGAEPPRPSRYNLYISGGNVALDGSQINNVTVRDIIVGIQEEIEKLPEGEAKNKALTGMQAILTNETFANVTGAAVGSFLSHLLK